MAPMRLGSIRLQLSCNLTCNPGKVFVVTNLCRHSSNTSDVANEHTHALSIDTLRYYNVTLVCDANVAKTSRIVAPFPLRSRNLDSFKVYKY